MSLEVLPTSPIDLISRNPATGQELGRAKIFSDAEVRKSVSEARSAQVAWATSSFAERSEVILRARKITLEQLNEIGELIAQETGKPVAEAISMEVVPSLDLMHYFAHQSAELLRPEKIPLGLYNLMGRSSRVVFKPLGVIGIISPWNFPWATPLAEVVMSLMAGNAAVVKPSELTPLTALKIAEVFHQAKLPQGLLGVTTGAGATGAALVTAGVNKIMFTGSVETGKRVAESAAKLLIPAVLELGGKDPMIVLNDANLANAARAATWGAFANAGQACASIERCYVHEDVVEKFTELVIKETKLLKQGQGDDIDLGPMTSERQAQIVEDHLTDAASKGARIVYGGKRGEGLFHQPTIVTNVDHSMRLMRHETFGPVLPIMTFKTDEEAVRLANDSIYGLTASVWSNNISRAQKLAAQVEAGTVMINEVVYTHALAQTPWGGVKQSGYGRTHGRLGLMELVTPVHIHVNYLPGVPDVWWFRYSTFARRLFGGLAKRFTTGSVFQFLLLLPQLARRLFERRD